MEELAGEVGLADTNLMLVIRVGSAVGVAPHMGPLAISGIWGMGGPGHSLASRPTWESI